MKLRKKIMIYTATVMLAAVMTVSAIFTYAYFSKKEIYDGYLSGQVELLFDRLDDTGIAAYSKEEGITASKEEEWGSRENPYVISNVRHLYNLSELQNIGYFHKKYIGEQTPKMPYFIVSNPDYTPVLINGEGFKEISAIGTDEYPFIGSVKGVHVSTEDEEGNPINGDKLVEVGENKSATSVFHKISVKGKPDNVDVGLFGHVSFLGDVDTPESDGVSFEGTPSVLSDIVLSDVTVKVENTLKDAIDAFIADIVLGTGGHRYSFSELYGVDGSGGSSMYDTVPHENHHIGILAGHVSYSVVEYISVYYSKDYIAAIDLTDATEIDGVKANYMSATGIIGFIYNLNPEIDESGNLVSGSGDSVSDLSYSMVGGGGQGVGGRAGYVLARNIYTTYSYVGKDIPADTSDGTIKISSATKEDGTPLCYNSVRDLPFGLSQDAGYYFYDGVFTFALSSDKDVIESTWNGEVDKFGLGSTNRADWVTNYTKGNKSVTAYLSKITNDMDLIAAEKAGKPIFVMREKDAQNIFLMSLFETSGSLGNDWDGFASNYTTNGYNMSYGDSEYVSQLLESYNMGTSQDFIDGFEIYGYDVTDGNKSAKVATIMGNLEAGEDGWKVIKVGTDSDSLPVSVLRQQYKIDVKTEQYKYYDEKGNAISSDSESYIYDYYDYNMPYDGTTYDGYFTYTTGSLISSRYFYEWHGKDGSTVSLTTGLGGLLGSGAPSSFFGSPVATWGDGENVYSYTTGGVTYSGVLVNTPDTGNYKFYGTNNAAQITGTNLIKPVGNMRIFFQVEEDGEYFYIDDLGNVTTYSKDDLVATEKRTSSDLTIYKDKNNSDIEGILVLRENFFSFSNNDNFMRLVYADYYGVYSGSTIWNGSDSLANSASNFKMLSITPSSHAHSILSTISFNDDGTCYIEYTYGKTTLYVSYNSSLDSGKGKFTGSTSQNENSKLCVYMLEATQSLNYGKVTYDPKAGTTDASLTELSASEYLLYATNGQNGTQYEVINVENLPNLGSEALGWNSGDVTDGYGGKLTGEHLTKKFHTEKGIDFGLVLSLGGYQLGTNGMITAPVGNAGVMADIPLSCVAFRVNKAGEQHIRVIISVAVSEYYVGEETNDPNTLGDATRYFNMWQLDESGSSLIQLFQKDQAVERFEIPISHPYEPGTSSTDASSGQGFYNVTYDNGSGAQTYGLYMNGDRLLVAYEFTVSEVGLYILGPSGFANNGGEDPDVPMEIVYFSADGVASSGRDGASGSQIGTIDYVYSYNEKIVTVTEKSSTDANGEEDYNTYYPSYCMTYFDTTQKDKGAFVSINNELMYVRRYIHVPTDEDPLKSSVGYNLTPSWATVRFYAERDKYASIVQYARLCDNVITNKTKE